MTVNKRSSEYKTIDPGFKTIVLPKILIKFDLKNITNTYIHKYKINFFWVASRCFGDKIPACLAPPCLYGLIPKSLSAAPITLACFLLLQHHATFSHPQDLIFFLLSANSFSCWSQLKCYFSRTLSPFTGLVKSSFWTLPFNLSFCAEIQIIS